MCNYRKSDLMIGGMFENPISRKVVHSSIPYYQDDVTWCLEKAGLAPSWLNVFIIFQGRIQFNFSPSLYHNLCQLFPLLVSTWIGIAVTLIITTIFFYFLIHIEGKYRENFVWSFLVTMSFSTGQYGHYWPVKGAIKIFLATMMFYGLHISTAYHSSLINVLTNPRYDKQIDSVDEAIAQGLIFEVGENTVDFFEKEDSVRINLFKLFNFTISFNF